MKNQRKMAAAAIIVLGAVTAFGPSAFAKDPLATAWPQGTGGQAMMAPGAMGQPADQGAQPGGAAQPAAPQAMMGGMMSHCMTGMNVLAPQPQPTDSTGQDHGHG